jgi:uncharacterized protein YgiM (DUF1202 family)
MKMRIVRQTTITAVLLAILALALLAPTLVQAQSSGENPTAVVNTGALNVRSGPDFTYSRVTVIYNGQTVSLLARYYANQWVKIRLQNGIEGWVNSNYLRTSVPVSSLPVVGGGSGEPGPTPPPMPDPGPNPTAVVNTGALNVRSGPSINFSVVAKVYGGQTVQLLGRAPNSSWVRVHTSSSAEGWVNSNFLVSSVPISSLPIIDGGSPPSSGATAVVNTGALNVRGGPGLAYAVITVIYQGQTVELLARNQEGSWVVVRLSNGTQGWANAGELITSVPVSSLPVTGAPAPVSSGTVAVGALNVRSGPGVEYNVITAVTHGQIVGLIGRNASSTWLQIQTPNGTVGWVNSSYIMSNVPIDTLPIRW